MIVNEHCVEGNVNGLLLKNNCEELDVVRGKLIYHHTEWFKEVILQCIEGEICLASDLLPNTSCEQIKHCRVLTQSLTSESAYYALYNAHQHIHSKPLSSRDFYKFKLSLSLQLQACTNPLIVTKQDKDNDTHQNGPLSRTAVKYLYELLALPATVMVLR